MLDVGWWLVYAVLLASVMMPALSGIFGKLRIDAARVCKNKHSKMVSC